MLQVVPSTSDFAAPLLDSAKRASRVSDTRILQVLWLGTGMAWRDVAVALAIAVAAAVTARAAFRWE